MEVWLESKRKVASIDSATRRTRTRFLRLLALLLVMAVTVAGILWRGRLGHFVAYGYPGIFLISLVANATIIFPVPSLALVFALGGVLNPVLVGLAAGLGEALGELTGYLAGYSGQAVIENREIYDRLHDGMRRYGLATIFFLSLLPNPFFDLAGIAAGVLRFPIGYFLLSCWLGKTLKTTVVALAGAHSFFLLGRFL
ncbi:MAG: DedA family protein [Anaerolineales bacterium]|nr:MAG: DedA family protein [Anaerolineales bacterium]